MTLRKWYCENGETDIVFVIKVPYTKCISTATFSLSQLTVTTIAVVKSSSFRQDYSSWCDSSFLFLRKVKQRTERMDAQSV